MTTIRFEPGGVCFEAQAGTTLLDAARRAGVEIEAPCNGLGTCGKCRVLVQESRAIQGSAELPHPDREEAAAPSRQVLACSTVVQDRDLVVRAPNVAPGGARVLLSGQRARRPHRPWVRAEWNEADHCSKVFYGDELLTTRPGKVSPLGLAMDVGTTTLVVALIDLERGVELGTLGALNPQTRLGHDVLSRIQIGSDEAGLAELHGMLTAKLREMTSEVVDRAGAKLDDLHEIVAAGNTTMLHLLANVNPQSLGRYPYEPALRGARALVPAACALVGAAQARVYLPPVLDGFVGADISAGILATDLRELRGVSLFIDVGTNGEMVLAVDGRLVATSTAAGPAFEGMNITHGMRAAPGAIEVVSIDECGVRVKTIGDMRACGICGSGLVDAVSEMVRHRIVDASGRFARPETLPPALAAALVPYEGRRAFCLARDGDGGNDRIVVTQGDIRQLQLAKGAMHAGLQALLAREHLSPTDVDRVLLAGSFGAHLKPASLAGIGLLPKELASRTVAVGNTSRTGAELLLLDRDARGALAEIVEQTETIDLAHTTGFERIFLEALAFPSGQVACDGPAAAKHLRCQIPPSNAS